MTNQVLRLVHDTVGYPLRVMPVVPAGAAYPVGYEEAESVLVQGTTLALMTAIVGNFPPHRNQNIREIYGQMGGFVDGVILECPNI